MDQVAKLLTDPIDGFLRHARFLIIDRDSKFPVAFREVLQDAGVRVLLSPASAPNCNAYAERFVRSIKDECLDRMILFGTAAPDRALREYEAHYLEERNHQGIGNELIDPVLGDAEGIVARRGTKKAIVAVAASMLTAIYYILRDRVPYRDLGPAHFDTLHKARAVNRLVRRLGDLGYNVALEPRGTAA